MGKFSANWHSYLAISCNASACHGQQLPCAHEVWTSRCRGSKGHQQWKLLRCHMWQSSVGYGETRHAASSAASSLSAEKVFLPFYAGEIASAICRADAQTLAHSVFCPMSISFLKLPPPACPAIYYLYCIHLNTYKAHTHTPPTHTHTINTYLNVYYIRVAYIMLVRFFAGNWNMDLLLTGSWRINPNIYN